MIGAKRALSPVLKGVYEIIKYVTDINYHSK